MVQNSERTQTRSPRYPRYPLQEAIDYARRLYEGAHRSTVDTHTAYRVMGFAGKSGASATALGATRQFGLVDGERGGVQVSDLGLAVLEPSGPEERAFALHAAANHPEIFEALMDHFAGDPPRSDEPLRSFLIRTRGFSKSGADECISSFRKTFSFVADVDRPEEASPAREATATAAPPGPQPSTAAATISRAGSQHEVLRIPLTRDCSAELSFSGAVTAQAVTRLMRHIELMQEVWAEQ